MPRLPKRPDIAEELTDCAADIHVGTLASYFEKAHRGEPIFLHPDLKLVSPPFRDSPTDLSQYADEMPTQYARLKQKAGSATAAFYSVMAERYIGSMRFWRDVVGVALVKRSVQKI